MISWDKYLPKPTPLDPAEDPPSSIDPLGTFTGAERIADLILPGFTARMWRARLLTFSAVAATIAERVVERRRDKDETSLDARLAFERLFVTALVHEYFDKPERRKILGRVPGMRVARRAAENGAPLERGNYLKGASVNGPFGVIARLARHLKLVDGEGSLGGMAYDLLAAWGNDVGLAGIADGEGRHGRAGDAWAHSLSEKTSSVLDGDWPGGNTLWPRLAAIGRAAIPSGPVSRRRSGPTQWDRARRRSSRVSSTRTTTASECSSS